MGNMENIEQYKNRFYNLMESKSGDVKPLLTENEIDGTQFDLKSKMESYKNKMDNFLNNLKSQGTTIDRKRFLTQVQNETDEMYWDMYDNDVPGIENFTQLQLDLLNHYRKIM